MAGNINTIPIALTAKSHTDLMKEMIQNQLTRAKQFDYQIMHVEGTWYAWYSIDFTEGSHVRR